ncbi:MerR family transcriptional regulator [Bailinhaonella thermotolerans]|uniref:MerR family transcriptional regulator n=1 Tax=Bailinhaonella thermotolerans TaxID=1070861 RepID=A0A3A4ARQ9_9ACTN|nr:MerR family transcriptional regulator [Bailinhaonella thermotolerans]RJL31831.1 MerR family transcriptional regulator [Bailinhaonella thermotolerans]
MSGDLTIGQVAGRTGLSVHTLRFYEREGILADPVRREPGGRRVYGEHHVEWLNLCVLLRASGMPLPAIREYTELVRRGGHTAAERLALLRAHRDRVRERMARLDECMDLIEFKIRVYEDHLEQGPPEGEHLCGAPAEEPAAHPAAS